MESIIFQANVIGMIAYIVPATLLFFWIIKDIEDKLIERKLYLACGIGVVLGTIADIIMIIGGVDLYSTKVGYASLILISPFVIIMILFIGVNLKTFKSEPAAPFYSAGLGLFFGGALEFWKLLVTQERYGVRIPDTLIIAGFGMGSLVFLGGAGMWISFGIKNDNGVRVASRITFLYLFLAFLNASALENIHYGVYSSTLITILALVGYLLVSGTLFHQGLLKLPKIEKNSLKPDDL